jgi:hypothetical protein
MGDLALLGVFNEYLGSGFLFNQKIWILIVGFALIPVVFILSWHPSPKLESKSGLLYRKKALSEPLQGISSALSSGHRGLLDAYNIFKNRIKNRNHMGVLRIESETLSQLFIEMESIVKPIDDELHGYEEFMQTRFFRSEASEAIEKKVIIGKLDSNGRAFSLRREILAEISKVLEKYGSA